MKNMKFWRTALVATLVLTVMLSVTGGTIAWFTDEVTSAANVIKSGTLDAEVYYTDENGKWADIEKTSEPLFNYNLWEPGYVATKGVKIVNAGDLAFKYQLKFLPNAQSTGAYKLEDVIDVYVSESAITNRGNLGKKVGTLAELMGEDGAVHGELLAGEEDDVVYIALKMQESAGNDYQNLSVGNGFGIELLATQHTYEKDSFNDQYDAEATYPQVVAVYNSAELNAAIATGAQKIQAGPGTYTLAGMSKKNVEIVGVGKETVIDLSAQKLGVDVSDITFTNLTVKTASENYTGIQHSGNIVYNNVEFEGSTFLYGESVSFNNCEFNFTDNYLWTYGAKVVNLNNCVFNTDGKAVLVYSEDAELTQTVNVNNCTFNATAAACTGDNKHVSAVSVDSSKVKGYTVNFTGTNKVDEDFNGLWQIKNATAEDSMPKTTIAENGKTIGMKSATPGNVASKIAEAQNGDVISLDEGTYTIDNEGQNKTLTFVGSGDTVLQIENESASEGCDYGLRGSTVTFENMVITTSGNTYNGYAGMNGVYNNCVINNTYTLYGDSEFNNCTFNVSGDAYNIWTWGAPNATFNGCTFNSDGKALFLYGTANTNLTVNNCVFNDNGGLTDLKAAIEIGNDYGKSYKLVVNNTTVNGYEINDKGINTGTTLWGNKNSMGTDKLNVVVDGVDVY